MDRFYAGPVIVRGPLLIRRHDRFARRVDDQSRSEDTVAYGLPLNDCVALRGTGVADLELGHKKTQPE